MGVRKNVVIPPARALATVLADGNEVTCCCSNSYYIPIFTNGKGITDCHTFRASNNYSHSYCIDQWERDYMLSDQSLFHLYRWSG